MVAIITSPPNGWNKWIYASTTFNVGDKTLNIPDADFPVIYTPSKSFMLRSIIEHCIPWINVTDSFSSYLLAGGNSPSIVGATGGLSVVNSLMGMASAGGYYGIFPTRQGGPGPRLGYCIGTKFKQQIYVGFNIENAFGQTLLIDAKVELAENSRFKRIYIYEGEVVDYDVVGDEHVLKIDLYTTTAPPKIIASGNIIIIKPDGTSFKLKIKSVKNNWDIVVSLSDEDADKDKIPSTPSTGDYYRFDKVWLIEDPSLLSSFYQGTENQNEELASGLNLYVSDKNKPYIEGKFLGVYLWVKKTSEENVESETTTTTTLGNYFQPAAGFNMRDSPSNTWAFLGFGNSDVSQTYNDDVRYKETILNNPDPENNNTITVYQTRSLASNDEYNNALSSSEYLRVEISYGGYYTRNNWFAPSLKGSYIKIDESLFKIMDHIAFNIIDVAINSVDGKTKFNPQANQNYSIINQYAWMINEDYMQASRTGSEGVFDGKVVSISGKTVNIRANGDLSVLRGKVNGYSFIGRYKNGVSLAEEHLKVFNRFQNWRLVSSKNEFIIDDTVPDSIVFLDPKIEGDSYGIKISLKDNPTGLLVGDSTYISFDKTYDTVNNYGKKSQDINLNGAAGLSGKNNNLFTISDQFCLDGYFLSAPYSIDIPIDTMFGVCDGLYFGTDANGTANSRGAQLSLLTTLTSERGIASLFHTLKQEDWVIYKDINDKITARLGSDNFTEYPNKSLIVVGKPELIEAVGSGNRIELNQTQEYLRRLQMKVPDNKSGNPALLFGIGSENSTYGFYVSGDGLVNLGFLEKQGIVAGETPSNTWTNEGLDVSPVYIYKRDYYSQLDIKHIDIGIKTSEGPIFVKDGDAKDVIAQYIKENQLLNDTGFFDVIRITDGEVIIIYGRSVNGFRIDGKINNSSDNGTKWTQEKAVFIIGSSGGNFEWGAPTSYDINQGEGGEDYNQYALMVLNSANFLSSIYNPISESIVIFAKCFSAKDFYIGSFITSVYNLTGNAVFCNPIDSEQRGFLWRSPYILDSTIRDTSKSWTDAENIIQDDFSYDDMDEPAPEDRFARIMGAESTKSQVINGNDFGIISTTMMPVGIYVLFYDAEGGIKALFSNNSGFTWKKSNIFWARNARSGVLIGSYLFYITDSGIETLHTSYENYCIANDFVQGDLLADKEIELQEEIELQDSLDTSLRRVLIGSGIIDNQRLSGYITLDGTIKVFFYDQNRLLKCIESKDSFRWNVAQNF